MEDEEQKQAIRTKEGKEKLEAITRTGYCMTLGLTEERPEGEAERGCEKPPVGSCQSSKDMLHHSQLSLRDARRG